MAPEPSAGRTVIAAGLMSGTSADGSAGALVRFSPVRGRPHFPRTRLLALVNIPYPRRLREFLLRLASGDPSPSGDFARASSIVASWSARTVSALLKRARVPRSRLSFVGVHGHTIYHGANDRPPVTWQTGDLSRLAEKAGVTVVGDFRARDAAAGGQGAPLAPYAHWVLFTHPSAPRLLLNIGGIANVTWLPPRAGFGAVRAFDTGPGNMLLDLLAARATGGRLTRDSGGGLASRGRVDRGLLRRLLAHPYFSRRPPKSTGREEFGARLLPLFRGLKGPDALATATAFTAESVARQMDRWLPVAARRSAVFACGGGARNPVLMRFLRVSLSPRRLLPADVLGFPAEAIEPVAFALLARARLLGLPNAMPAVTGARRAVSGGAVVPA